MNKKRFQELVSQFNSNKIVVIGDLMLDSYLWGKAERISPEAPVPVIHVEQSNHNPGGAGNVALNLIGLSAGVTLFGVIGSDTQAGILTNLLEKEGIDIAGVIVDSNRPTTVKTRVIAQNQQVVRVDQETETSVDDKVHTQLLEKLKQVLPDCDALILEDYNKGLFSSGFIREIIAIAHSNNKPVYVDPKREHFFEFTGVRMFKPNYQEFQMALGNDFSERNFTETGMEFRAKINAQVLMITLGEKGISIFSDNGCHTISTRARRVHDVSGAGDTVISTFTITDLSGASPEEAAVLANYAAGRVCEEVGVVPITLKMLTEMVHHHNDD